MLDVLNKDEIEQLRPFSQYLFGNYHANPLKRYYYIKRDKEHLQEEVRIRTTCCLSYLLDGASNRCKTCPQTCSVKR